MYRVMYAIYLITFTFLQVEFRIALSILVIVLIVSPIISSIYVFSLNEMMARVQNHTLFLADTSRQLNEERKLTENLLYRLLPASVANDLRNNRPVDAVSYDSVTILFTDIVGFTSIAANISPLAVNNS